MIYSHAYIYYNTINMYVGIMYAHIAEIMIYVISSILFAINSK